MFAQHLLALCSFPTTTAKYIIFELYAAGVNGGSHVAIVNGVHGSLGLHLIYAICKGSTMRMLFKFVRNSLCCHTTCVTICGASRSDSRSKKKMHGRKETRRCSFPSCVQALFHTFAFRSMLRAARFSTVQARSADGIWKLRRGCVRLLARITSCNKPPTSTIRERERGYPHTCWYQGGKWREK